MDDFDIIMAQAQRVVDTSRKVATNAFPNGAVLQCVSCAYRRIATTQQCARYFTVGWPVHCGRTMSAGKAP